METINDHTFELFNQSQTAQASLSNFLTFYGDGVPFGSTIHPIKVAGGTQSNADANGIPLTGVNLEVGRLAMMAQRGDRDETLRFGHSKMILLVAPANEKKALELVKSDLKAETANNDVNIYRNGLMTVMSSQLLSTANGWDDRRWMLLDPMKHRATFFTRRPLTIGSAYETNSNKNVTIDVSTRHKVAPADWRGFWVSRGNSAAYAL